MARTQTLSVRLDPQTRRILSEAARTHDAAGASALARDILERWAANQRDTDIRQSVGCATEYLRNHPAGWNDDPADFFPSIVQES